MRRPMPLRIAVALGALAITIATLLTNPVQAQYGGYDGGYERRRSYDDDHEPRRSYDRGYDRRRSYEDDDDRRRGRRDDYDRGHRDDYNRIPGGGYDGSRGGGGAPQARGGFVQSCRDIEQDGYYLSASCRMRGGGYTRSRIDVRSCRSIGNNDGRLVCE